MTLALLNKPSAALQNCELTFLERTSIDFERALAQHSEYARTLASLGARVEVLDVNVACPDGVFVEDSAVVLDEIAVITSMGAPSRRAEFAAMETEIGRHRPLSRVRLPATLEGGDVLRMGRVLYVGQTSRTNGEGIEALRTIVSPLGYTVVRVPVPNSLHLKTCVTALDDETLLINSTQFDTSPFKMFRLVEVDHNEPWAANALRLNRSVVLNASYPKTADKVEAFGYSCVRVDVSEFGKAEAGLTCMSLLFAEQDD